MEERDDYLHRSTHHDPVDTCDYCTKRAVYASKRHRYCADHWNARETIRAGHVPILKGTGKEPRK